jgi:hypothetical protein
VIVIHIELTLPRRTVAESAATTLSFKQFLIPVSVGVEELPVLLISGTFSSPNPRTPLR